MHLHLQMMHEPAEKHFKLQMRNKDVTAFPLLRRNILTLFTDYYLH